MLDSGTMYYLHWNDTGLPCDVCHPLRRSCRQYSTTPCSFPAGKEFTIRSVVTTPGDVVHRHFHDSTGLAPSQAAPAVEQQFAVEHHQTPSVDCCLTLLYSGIDTMDSLRLSKVRCTPRSHSLSSSGGHEQCFPPWVGCNVESQGHSWPLVSSSVKGSHHSRSCMQFSWPCSISIMCLFSQRTSQQCFT